MVVVVESFMLPSYTINDLCKEQRYLESKMKSSLLIDIIFKLLFYIIMCSIVMRPQVIYMTGIMKGVERLVLKPYMFY